MKKKIGRTAALTLLSALCLFLSGCAGLRLGTVEDLYCLPSLPGEYQDLETSINALIEDGAEYAAPSSGSNIQPVQLVDLDGDGQEEALAFMRKPSEEKPLKIYIFSAKSGRYQQSAVIEGSGSAIFSIVYSDLDGDGHIELVVGWKTASEMQALSIYTLRNGQPEELLRTTYVKYALTDLDGDGHNELVTFHADTEGMGIAEMYTWQDGTMALESSSKISVTMNRRDTKAELTELLGKLRERIPSLVLRTSIIAGLPLEDSAAFEELCEFLRETKIERAGVFPFSPEDGTLAAKMDHVDAEETRRRAELLVDVQSDVIDGYNESVLGTVREVLCEGFDSQTQLYYGRSFSESPDIDGRIWFEADQVRPGTFINIRLTGTMDGELTGEKE